MEESTYLSRAFSDQGVRLRLRKEPRAMMGNKRPYPYGPPDTASTNTPIRPNVSEYSYGDSSGSPNKRYRVETEDRKENFVDHSPVSGAGYTPTYTSAHYPVRQSGLHATYGVSPYPQYGGLASGSAAANIQFNFRGMGNTSSTFYADSLLPTSGALASQHRYQGAQTTYPQPFPTYRSTATSSLSFPDDGTGLGGYRTDEHRPASTTGVSSGISHSQSPEMLRSGGFYNNRSVEIKRANSHQPSETSQDGQVADHSNINNLPVYQNPRNAYQAPTSDPNLTSHIDTGVTNPPLLHYNPVLSQSTELHSANSG